MSRIRYYLLLIILLIFVFSLIGYHYYIQASEVRIRVATTTSLYATGLLQSLSDAYRENHPNIVFDFIAVGSGEALRRAESGDVCMVFVHAPSLEVKYIKKGILSGHRIFAYNYFIIAGPHDDPAGIRNASSAVDAFKKIYEACSKGYALFISRGDLSGTNVKELSIWSKAGLNPKGKPWYLETGSGMGETLIVANEKGGYVLTDIGTYLKFKMDGRIPNLDKLYSKGEELINVYSVYLVSTCRHRDIVIDFINFIMDKGQDIIKVYGVSKYGENLFYPAAPKLDYLNEIWNKLASGG